ncbi:MAG: peptidyl-prolyl cis-trans isomerase [Planctomycetaceae bacterium]
MLCTLRDEVRLDSRSTRGQRSLAVPSVAMIRPAYPPQPCRSVRRLRRLAVLLVLSTGLVSFAGCNGFFKKKVDNPVVGPRPPRIAGDQLAESASDATGARVALAEADGGPIRRVSASTSAIQDEDVAARVNGRPIFVSEVLERHRGMLEANRGRVPPAVLEQKRMELIQEDLDSHIEQALALTALYAKLEKEQKDQLQDRLDEFFYEKEIPDLQKKLGVDNLAAVEARMQEAGTTLATYRRVWGERTLAAQYIAEQLPQVTVSRQDLLAAYHERVDDYREPAQVQWQQCRISNIKNGGQAGARAKLQEVVAELRQGASFGEVIKKHSDGPRASQEGMWDWAQLESLADEKLRRTLGEIEVGQIGPVIEDEQGYRLIKLTGRRDARVQPFEEVQDELREAITRERRAASAQELINKLRSEAHIETIFDEQPVAADEAFGVQRLNPEQQAAIFE